MLSNRSQRLNLPAPPVRSGPTEPPSGAPAIGPLRAAHDFVQRPVEQVRDGVAALDALARRYAHRSNKGSVKGKKGGALRPNNGGNLSHVKSTESSRDSGSSS